MSSEDFKSLIVTDPDLIDEGIDVSGLRTQTNTNPRLLGAIEEYPGISYDPTSYSYLSDLNRLYASGLPETDTSQPTTPAPPSGGGGGGGGTSPGTGGTTPTQPDSIGGFDPGVTPGPSGFIGLDPDMDIDIRDYDEPGTYEPNTYQGTPGGNTGDPGGYFNLIDNSGKNFGPYSSSMPSMLDQTGRMGATTPPSTFGTPVDVEQGFTQDFSAPGTLSDPLEKMDFVSGADVNNPKGLLDKLGLKGFDPAEALVKTAINAAFGKPVTLFMDILNDLLPPTDPRATAMSDFYKRDDIGRVAEGELMAGYNPVSGSDLLNKMTFGLVPETTYGLQDAYDDRIDTIENTLANKYKMTATDIADVKAGNYKGDVDTVLFQRLMDLEEAKEKEKARLDLFSGDVDPSGEGTGDASIAEKIAEADRLGISGDIGVEGEDTDRFGGGADMSFDADTFDDDVNLTGTPPTGTITPLEDDFEFDTPTGINTGINLGPRRLDQDLSTLGDDLSASLGLDKKVNIMDDLDNLYADSGTIMSDATIVDDLPSPPTGTDRPGGDRDPAPSAPVSTAGQAGPPSQRGGGADSSPSTGRGRTDAQSQYGGTSYGGPPSQSGGGGGGGGGGGKIVCTMMNDSYGFGSFRNKIWLKHSKDMAPEYQRGYHKIFLPLVKIAKTNKVVRKILEHIAVHRTIDIRQESRGKVHLLGRVYRKILEPICYIVGKYAK